MNLPPFNPAAICPKCGHGDVSTRYEESYCTSTWSTTNRCPARGEGEHIDRQCRRCQYRWAEAPLDRVAT